MPCAKEWQHGTSTLSTIGKGVKIPFPRGTSLGVLAAVGCSGSRLSTIALLGSSGLGYPKRVTPRVVKGLETMRTG